MEVRSVQSGRVPRATDERSETVLVVDDNEEITRSLSDILSIAGFDTLAVNSGQQALELLQKKVPDIILCDVMMPGIDGYRLNTELRKHSEWCNIPFIFLTALASKSDLELGRSFGCDEYLTKPFDPDALIALLRGKLALSKDRAKKREERLDRYRRRIIHTLSHEFRTPLVAINTGTELLLEQFGEIEAAQVKRLLESVHRGGIRLQRLVDDFMTLQQIDSGVASTTARELSRQISLLRIADVAVECFQEVSRQERMHIIIEHDASVKTYAPIINVYDIHVISAVQRVLSNACKFAGQNHEITLSISSDVEFASLKIRDNGPGMSQKMAQEAVETFVQIDRDRLEQQGCGLGLTISSYFVALNGGELVFNQPKDGPGLEVEIRFPREGS